MPNDIQHREEEGSYLVSVSDLMIGLLFVFLLMLMAFALQYRNETDAYRANNSELSKRTTDLQQKNDELAREKADWERQKSTLEQQLADERSRVKGELQKEIQRVEKELQSAQKARNELLTALRDRLLREGIVVQVDMGSGVLRLPDSVLFQTLRANLSDASPASGKSAPHEIVRRLAAAMAAIVPCYAEVETRPLGCPSGAVPILEAVFIEGHTDKKPIQKAAEFCESYEGPGGFCDNYQLSTARALSTYKAMLEDQPQLRDLRNPAGDRLFGLSGYGSDRPIASGDSESDLAANRRIDIRFLLAAPPSGRLDELRQSVERRLLQAPSP